jgi:hypothetical protein
MMLLSAGWFVSLSSSLSVAFIISSISLTGLAFLPRSCSSRRRGLVSTTFWQSTSSLLRNSSQIFVSALTLIRSLVSLTLS